MVCRNNISAVFRLVFFSNGALDDSFNIGETLFLLPPSGNGSLSLDQCCVSCIVIKRSIRVTTFEQNVGLPPLMFVR